MTTETIILCAAAFSAGFIDSIVGGGGLVQTPVTLVTLRQYPLATVLGTTKIPSLSGALIAAFQYGFRVVLEWRLLTIMCSIALVASYTGSTVVSHLSNSLMKPVIFCVLIVVAVYTYFKKDFGLSATTSVTGTSKTLSVLLFALVIGFYDGFIGPGTGSFMVLFFISVLGFDFLKASAHSKLLNVSTNLGSILYFGNSGHILFQHAIPMAIFNFAGAILGSRLAILKGNTFIRVFFLLVVVATILRFGYDIFIR